MFQSSSGAERLSSLLAEEVVGTRSLQVSLVPHVHKILNDIGFPAIAERFCGDGGDVETWKVFEAYIHSRVQVQSPVPVSRIEEWLDGTVLPHVLDVPASKMNEYRVGRVLEAIGSVTRGFWLELVASAHRAFRFDLEWTIYDVSSMYFEGEYSASELAEYGYSRDGRPGNKQVNIGLNVSGEHGIPLYYHLLPGSTEDSTTVVENLLEIKALYKQLGADGAPEILGDQKMLSAELVQHYVKNHVDFIGCMGTCNLTKAVIAGVPQELLFEHPLDYTAHRHRHLQNERREQERYYAVRTVLNVPAHADVPGSVAVAVPCLVVLASGKKRLDQQKRETLLSRTEERLIEIQSYLNGGKYKKKDYAQQQIRKALSRYAAVNGLIGANLSGENDTLRLTWSRDQVAIDNARRGDGKYVVLFSKASTSTDEIFRKFKGRDRVEKRTDDIKGPGPVVVRPIYLHTDERIKGLVLGSMIGLLVVSIVELMVQRRLRKKMTIESLQKTFATFAATVHTLSDNSQVLVMPHSNAWQGQILKGLGITLQVVTAIQPGAVHRTRPAAPPWQDLPGTDVPGG